MFRVRDSVIRSATRSPGRVAVLYAFIGLSAGSLVAEEVPTAWQLIDDGDPSPGQGTLVYDSNRGLLVRTMTAGPEGPPLTWELNGTDWVRRYIPEPTPWNAGGDCAAYDRDRGVLVLFGGNAGEAGETWEYDGTTWTERQTNNVPPGRFACGLAYDETRQVTVLFGGWHTGTTGFMDHWEYDGTDWAQIFPRDVPNPRGDVAMVYDSTNEEVVLFGGGHLIQIYGDTWVYDGRNWRLKNTTTAPSPREGVRMAHDRLRGVTVLFGGFSPLGDDDDTWEWDGSSWSQVVSAAAPIPRRHFALAYDEQRGKVVGHGGRPGDGEVNDTWEWDGTNWTEISETRPAARKDHALSYDPELDVVVLAGGEAPLPIGQVDDTWHLVDAESWVQQGSAGSPSANEGRRLAWEASRKRHVSYSGKIGPELKTDVNEYSGVPRQWAAFPGCCPDGRLSYGWTDAPPLGGVLMFGGWACCGVSGGFYPADDTWVLDGLNWTEHHPGTQPSGRRFLGLTWMDVLGKAVLYGGSSFGASARTEDTWLYDGQDWQLVMDPSPPGLRYGHNLVYDPERQRAILFGNGTPLDATTWEFDGISWIAKSTPFQPDADRCFNDMTWDASREVAILFGGDDCTSSIVHNDTWAYGADPDEDGVVGKLDNCVDTANDGQVNGDGDAAGDACDCAPSDPSVFSPPQPVSNVRVDGDDVTWNDQAPDVGSGVTYGLVTGSVADLRSAGDFSGASCLAPDLASPAYTDTRPVPLMDGFYYLVRAENACGVGTYGRAELDASSPCP